MNSFCTENFNKITSNNGTGDNNSSSTSNRNSTITYGTHRHTTWMVQSFEVCGFLAHLYLGSNVFIVTVTLAFDMVTHRK